MYISMFNILNWTSENPSQRKFVEGEEVFKAKHVLFCTIIEENASDEVTLLAACLQTSHIREKPHEITGIINKLSGVISDFKCTCAAGSSGKCKHIVATLLYVYTQDSIEKFSHIEVQLLKEMSEHKERCCVEGCKSKSSDTNDIIFHKFPTKDKHKVLRINHFEKAEYIDRLYAWKLALKINVVNPRLKVCSLHFKTSDYVLADLGVPVKHLKKTSVPSVNLPLSEKDKENSLINDRRKQRIEKRKLSQESSVTKLPLGERTNGGEAVEIITEDSDFNQEKNKQVRNRDFSDDNIVFLVAKMEDVKNSDILDLIKEHNVKAVKKPIQSCSFTDGLNTNEKVCTVTGLCSIKLLDTIIKMIELVYGSVDNNLSIRDRIVLTYMKLKHNMTYRLLALIFGEISPTICEKIFSDTILLLDDVLSPIISWPSKEEISKNLPKCFEGFEDTRVILDCTEIFIQHPQNLCCQLLHYSHYKSHATVKFLIGVSPAGTITFLSDAYGGRASDSAIFSQSNLIKLLEPNDGVMVDRGFLIDEICTKNRWKLIRPPFLQDKKQFNQSESIATSKIAAARVHVERFNQRIKAWGILSGIMPQNLVPIADKIVRVLCASVNMSNPLLGDDKFMDIKEDNNQ